jgi:DNA helicase-2/ATP-dependent DNA helicase PcrA
VLKFHRKLFSHILVDEYQDTNKIQADIVEIISGKDGNLMVVGDDAQSIYSFRGANFANIIDFPKRFKNCKTYKLETNYRSTPEILSLANSIIIHNRRQFRKVLKPIFPSRARPEVVICSDEAEQASFVSQKIADLYHDGINLKDMAVLYRSHYHSLELQMELQSMKIPFEVRSGLRFFEQAHIKDVSAFIKVAINPKDRLAFKRILKLYPKIGIRIAEKICDKIIPSDSPISKLNSPGINEIIPKGARKGLDELSKLLKKISTPTYLKKPSLVIRTILEGGYSDYLIMSYPNFSSRIDDIKRLSDYAMRFNSCEELLSELTLASNVQSEDIVLENKDKDLLVLSTVHQAKGLEWRYVFVIWLVDGKFPDARSISTQESLEEERRLIYVASTRAKEGLYLVYPIMSSSGGYEIINKPSRFLKELKKGTYEEVVVRTREDF